ncbi:MAG: hypothetical protein AB7E59_13265 [Pusillimonas sp.]
MVHVLNYPIHHESWFDIITNHLDGDWYEKQNPINLARNIDIPVYLQINQGRGWTVDGTIELFDVLKGPKKLEIGPYPPMQTRPWVDDHDTMFRCYDYWLKGIDNGIMDEPAVKVHVEGTRHWATGNQWPVKDIKYRPLYLRTRGKLAFEPEPYSVEHAHPEGFYQAPLTITDKVEKLSCFGHKLVVELMCNEPLVDEHNSLLPPWRLWGWPRLRVAIIQPCCCCMPLGVWVPAVH